MGFVEARVNLAIDAALGNAVYGQMHTGDPGAAGTANVAANVDGREQYAFPGASGAATQASAEFTITDAQAALTHISLWTAASDGTFLGSGEVSPAESFAGPGTLDVTVTVTGSSD